jgi:hypothetical protein
MPKSSLRISPATNVVLRKRAAYISDGCKPIEKPQIYLRVTLWFLFVTLCNVFSNSVSAQTPSKSQIINQAIQNAIENIGSGIDLEELEYNLSWYYDHPLDLNIATQEQLQDLGLLNELQIESLLRHRQQYGKLLSIYELQAVQNFDLLTIRRILPFVRVEAQPEQKPLVSKNELLIDAGRQLEPSAGYTYPNPNLRFLGDPNSLFLRYNYRLGDRFGIGLAAAKDAGEEFFEGSQKNGFDFYSAHLFYSPLSSGEGTGVRLKSLIIGDYQVQFGQGLVCWNSVTFNKTADVLRIARSSRGIVPNRTVNDAYFFRGAAATFELPLHVIARHEAISKISITPFASYHKLDGHPRQDSSLTAEDALAVMLSTDYHRNLSELQSQKQITERLAGINADYQLNHFTVGFTALSGQRFFSNDSISYSDPTEEFRSYGIHYSWQYRNLYLFGETASSSTLRGICLLGDLSPISTIQGLIITLNPKLDLALSYRNFSPDFNNPYAYAFGNNTNARNEQGIYSAINYAILSTLRLSAYADIFNYPAAKYRVDAPSSGFEYLTDLLYAPDKKLKLEIRYQIIRQQQNFLSDIEKSALLLPVTTQHLRVTLDFIPSERWLLEPRIEFSQYQAQKDSFGHADPTEAPGFMAYQDVTYTFKDFPLQLIGRYTFFDISNFYARIYTVESNMRYAFSIPSFDGQGCRYYLLANYKLKHGLTVSVRFARTVYYDREIISSGVSQINAPHKSEVRVQMRWVF